VGLERGPLVNNLRSYLEEIVASPGLSAKVGTSFADRRRSVQFASGLKTTEFLLCTPYTQGLGEDTTVMVSRSEAIQSLSKRCMTNDFFS
jgi:hypothetical protein